MEFIAEIGNSWKREDTEVSFCTALESIKVAAQSGATIVKFQLFTADTLYNPTRAQIQHERIKAYELPAEWLPDLYDTALDHDVEFWLSVFDTGLAWLASEDIDGIKIASGDITNIPLITEVAKIAQEKDIPIAVSTGAANEDEVELAATTVRANWVKQRDGKFSFYLFQCLSAYPAFSQHMNLAVIKSPCFSLADAVGLSDHSLTETAAQIAVGMGYQLFEKHFMLDDTSEECPDYGHSLTPNEFAWYVEQVKSADKIVGESIKQAHPTEVSERKWARRGSDGLRPDNNG